MFLDLTGHSGFPGDGPGPTCPSCKRPIAASDAAENLRFDPDPVHRLEEMNGLYHADCAKPYMSLQRALKMLTRFSF